MKTTSAREGRRAARRPRTPPVPPLPVVEANRVSRSFGRTQALRDVSLDLRGGQIHALLGPNGAGKSTLLRVLSGLVEPEEGEIRILGTPSRALPARRLRMLFGIVPPGYRAFYLRLSALENLTFFGRLYGLSRGEAIRRARPLLDEVGLSQAANVRVGLYSEGMYKRLATARALLTDPPILLVDEATAGLDPDGSRRVQDLIRRAAARGAAVLWTTQRLDEIRGLADRVTLLHRGAVRFTGTVPELMSRSLARAYLLHLRAKNGSRRRLATIASEALHDIGSITLGTDADGAHYRVTLGDGAFLGDAIVSLTASGIQVLACREERSEIEEAFLMLTRDGAP